MSGSYFMLKFLRKERRKKQLKLQNNNPISYYNNDTETLNVNKNTKCRICLKEGSVSIFDLENYYNLVEAINTFCGIDICQNDEYPKHLCDPCHSFLNTAVAFRKTAQDTEKLLRLTPPNEIEEGNSDSAFDTVDNECDNEVKSQNSYCCKICKLNFESFDKLIAHKKSKTHKKVRIQCPLCYRLLTAQLYKKHLARHKSASHLVCDICGKLYRKDNLVRHLQLHSFELPFHCQICPYRGRFMESLKIHMRTHTGDKPFSCDKCELRFLTRSNLNRHLLTHRKERPFKCVECGRGFYTKRDMEIHFKADHAGLKEFSCRVCGNKYGTRKALMRHELRVHKRDKMAKGRMPLYLQAEYQKQGEIPGSN